MPQSFVAAIYFMAVLAEENRFLPKAGIATEQRGKSHFTMKQRKQMILSDIESVVPSCLSTLGEILTFDVMIAF